MKRAFANKRDSSEVPIVAALRAIGCSVVLMDTPVDLLIGYRGIALIAECKTPGTQYGKKLNSAQAEFQEAWKGPPVMIFYDPEGAVRQINETVKIYAGAA